jgi:hypothetical protein
VEHLNTLTNLLCDTFCTAPLVRHRVPCSRLCVSMRRESIARWAKSSPGGSCMSTQSGGHGTRQSLDTLTNLLCDTFCTAPLWLSLGVLGDVPNGTSSRGFEGASSQLPRGFTQGVGFQAFCERETRGTDRPRLWVPRAASPTVRRFHGRTQLVGARFQRAQTLTAPAR